MKKFLLIIFLINIYKTNTINYKQIGKCFLGTSAIAGFVATAAHPTTALFAKYTAIAIAGVNALRLAGICDSYLSKKIGLPEQKASKRKFAVHTVIPGILFYGICKTCNISLQNCLDNALPAIVLSFVAIRLSMTPPKREKK